MRGGRGPNSCPSVADGAGSDSGHQISRRRLEADAIQPGGFSAGKRSFTNRIQAGYSRFLTNT